MSSVNQVSVVVLLESPTAGFDDFINIEAVSVEDRLFDFPEIVRSVPHDEIGDVLFAELLSELVAGFV